MCIPQGWSYVGDRLLSAVIPYEESGWYDGQMWVKPTEVSISLSIIYMKRLRAAKALKGTYKWRHCLKKSILNYICQQHTIPCIFLIINVSGTVCVHITLIGENKSERSPQLVKLCIL